MFTHRRFLLKARTSAAAADDSAAIWLRTRKSPSKHFIIFHCSSFRLYLQWTFKTEEQSARATLPRSSKQEGGCAEKGLDIMEHTTQIWQIPGVKEWPQFVSRNLNQSTNYLLFLAYIPLRRNASNCVSQHWRSLCQTETGNGNLGSFLIHHE